MIRIHVLVATLALGAALANGGTALAQPAPPTTAPASPAAASKTTAYLKVQGVEGESTDAAHPGWITLLSVSVPRDVTVESPRDPQSGQATAARRPREVTVTKRIDKASPKLREAMTRGTLLPTVVLEIAAPNNAEHYQITLTEVRISKLLVRAAVAGSGEELPKESMSLSFAKIEVKYGTLDPKGNRGPLAPAPPTFDCTRVNKIE